MTTAPDIQDIVAIGAGPSNLSLAALAQPVSDLRIVVLERREAFAWHPGIMLEGVMVGTAPVKDLVTLVDPTNRYSFLNFLVEQGRIYRFLIANWPSVTRREFSQYYTWAADQLESVRFGIRVARIQYDGATFLVDTSEGTWRARNLVLGTGHVPHIPDFAKPWLCRDVFHSAHFLTEERCLAGRDVLLVGGGQSATEVAYHTLSDTEKLPRSFTWVTGRGGFLPLDNSPFSNEWFNPQYVRHFQSLARTRRRELLDQHLLASDGAWPPLLLQIYRRLYELDYLDDCPFSYELLGGVRMVDLSCANPGYEVTLYSPDVDEQRSMRRDVVILATGYRPRIPEFMRPLRQRVFLEDDWYAVSSNFSVRWDGPADHRIFVQNGARLSHGVADSNLSVAAWRSAVIINEVCGRTIYPTDRDDITIALRDSQRTSIASHRSTWSDDRPVRP